MIVDDRRLPMTEPREKAGPTNSKKTELEGRHSVESGEEDQGTYNSELKKKTRSSVAWTALRLASNQLFAFVVFVALARLLSPHEIGTFAIVTLFSELGRILASGGLVNYIARAKTLSPELLDTIFWANMALAVVTSAVVILLAYPILNAIGQPYAAEPLMVVAALLPIVAASASHVAVCLRRFAHKSMAIRAARSGPLMPAGASGRWSCSGWSPKFSTR
jgi:hypothetical protein